MKRVLYALAALWLGRPKGEDRRREAGEDRRPKTEDGRAKTEERSRKTEEWGLSHDGLWLPEARNGLLRHLNAMMRMGETVRELATRECTHVPSRESAKRQPSESANLQISSTNQQIDEPTPKNTDNHLPKRVILSEREQPAERIGEPLPIAQVLARVYLRNAPYCTRGSALAEPHIGESSTKHESATQQINTPAHHRSPIALTAFIFAVFMCLLSAQQVSAQAEPAAAAVIQPLQIGDTIPEELWHLPLQVVNHPEGKETITLDEYRGKLIILDFWATWCGSCIAAMPRMHELQNIFGDNLAILPSTYEAKKKALDFLNTNEVTKPLVVPTIVNERGLHTYFPHRLLPHYVWISEAGQYLSATGTSAVNKENVSHYLSSHTLSEQVGLKVDVDPSKPIFLENELLKDVSLRQFSIFIKGYYQGLPAGPFIHRDSTGANIGFTISNFSLLDLYYHAVSPLFLKLGDRFDLKRVIVEPEQMGTLIGEDPADLVSVSLRIPDEDMNFYYTELFEMLNSYSEYSGRIEKRKTACYIVTPSTKFGDTSGNENLHVGDRRRMDVTRLIRLINDSPGISFPIVDESGYQGVIEAQHPSAMDLGQLSGLLSKYGLKMEKGERELLVLYLDKK